MDYMLKRWVAFTRFLSDGRICLTNNAAERMLRGAALGRKAWLFAGSDQGGERTAAMYSQIQTAELNGIDPCAWLADLLARIADIPQQKLHELPPRNWKKQQNVAPSTARKSKYRGTRRMVTFHRRIHPDHGAAG
jgi:transposase